MVTHASMKSFPTIDVTARDAYAACHRLGWPELVTALLVQLDEAPAPAFGASTDLLTAQALFVLLGRPTTITVEEDAMHS